MIGPPESPWQVSVRPLPAQSIVVATNVLRYAEEHVASLTIGMPASCRFVVVAHPLSQVVPQPMTVAIVPGAQSAPSLASTRESG
jgi:hypothetical protein